MTGRLAHRTLIAEGEPAALVKRGNVLQFSWRNPLAVQIGGDEDG
jgi:hypothetical protein